MANDAQVLMQSEAYDYYSLLNQFGLDYLNKYVNTDNDKIYKMDELDKVLENVNRSEVIRMAISGRAYPHHRSGFDTAASYFYIDEANNLVSIGYYYLSDRIAEVIDEELFVQYLIDNKLI